MDYRNRIFVLGMLSVILMNSCTKGHPPLDVPTTLPNVIFPFRVYPDTIHLKVGDTLKLHAAISAKLNDTVHLSDGNVSIGIDIVRYSTDPITVIDPQYIVQDEDYSLIMYGKSDVRRHDTKPKIILGLNTSYDNDSFAYKYDLIFLKKGSYSFQLGSNQNHLISSLGKGYPSGYFNVPDRHYNLWQVPGIDTSHPGDYGYDKGYFISVR